MDVDSLIAAISQLWRPGNFYVGNGLRCAWQFEATQQVPWELFRGTLVESSRAPMKTFLAWNLLPVDSGHVADDPLISVLLDEPERLLHVTRGYLVYAQEIDAALETHEVQRWTRELVGMLALDDYSDLALVAEIRTLIGQAIVGASRLPLTSVEAPHPAFSLGQISYVPREDAGDRPLRRWSEMLAPNVPMPATILEAALRAVAPDDIDAMRDRLDERRGLSPPTRIDTIATTWSAGINPAARQEIASLIRQMFNEVSLSPYSGFVDNALALAAKLLSPTEEIDLVGYLLRQLGRHLTAYDLVLFHYRGANYPDALFLDALLRRFLDVAAASPDLLADRMRRRALRQGLLLRRRYEMHAVPDAPTSPGENVRVLPEPFARIDGEQIEHPGRRRRLLFEHAPTVGLVPVALKEVVAQAFADLELPAERRELGMALFIDRPLGFHRQPAEVDATPLLSYEAFSETLANGRLREVARLAAELDVACPATSDTPGKPGAIWSLGLDRIPESPRPAVSLADARKVAADFRFLRTTRSSAVAFWRCFEVTDLPVADWPLVARTIVAPGKTRMTAFDPAGVVRLEFEIDPSAGFMRHGGVEVPRAGLIVAENERIRPSSRVH